MAVMPTYVTEELKDVPNNLQWRVGGFTNTSKRHVVLLVIVSTAVPPVPLGDAGSVFVPGDQWYRCDGTEFGLWSYVADNGFVPWSTSRPTTRPRHPRSGELMDFSLSHECMAYYKGLYNKSNWNRQLTTNSHPLLKGEYPFPQKSQRF